MPTEETQSAIASRQISVARRTVGIAGWLDAEIIFRSVSVAASFSSDISAFPQSSLDDTSPLWSSTGGANALSVYEVNQ